MSAPRYGRLALSCLLLACLMAILALPELVARVWMLMGGGR